jgi:hypothetical protein
MPFIPKVKVTEIPRSSSYFKLIDNTPDYTSPTVNPYGYGVVGGPGSFDDIIETRTLVQFYGEGEVEVPVVLEEGDFYDSLIGLKVNYALRDGVHKITQLYGMDCAISGPTGFTWAAVPGSTTKLLCTLAAGSTAEIFNDYLGNVTHLSNVLGTKLFKVKSLNTTTGVVEFYETVLPTAMVKYYPAEIRVLVINKGEASIIKDISNAAVTNCGCDYGNTSNIFERIFLKLAAQTAFACGNYAKAHNAAVLLSNTDYTSKPCTTC